MGGVTQMKVGNNESLNSSLHMWIIAALYIPLIPYSFCYITTCNTTPITVPILLFGDSHRRITIDDNERCMHQCTYPLICIQYYIIGLFTKAILYSMPLKFAIWYRKSNLEIDWLLYLQYLTDISLIDNTHLYHVTNMIFIYYANNFPELHI